MSQVADSQSQKVVLNVKFGTFQWLLEGDLFLFRSSNHLAWVHSIRVVHQDIDLVLCLTLRRALRYLRQRPGFTSHEPRNFGISTRSQEFAIYLIYIYILPPKEKHQLESTTIKWRFQRLRSWNGNSPHLLKLPENHRGWGFATMTIGRDDQMPETLQGHRGWTPNYRWMKVMGGFFRFSVPFSPIMISVQW